MNNVLLKCTTILFLCIMVISAQAQFAEKYSVMSQSEIPENYTGIISDNYPDGKPKIWKQYENGKASGLWLEWYPNGEMRYKAKWRNGKGHGKWEYFYDNGQLRSEYFFTDDLAQGLFSEYHTNGTLAKKGVYWDNKLHGELASFSENGILTTSKTYARGLEIINKPQKFMPGKLSTDKHSEFNMCFTPDGNTAYITRRLYGKKEQKIYVSEKKDNSWSEPEIASFSTSTDESPHVTADGNRLLFCSFRPLPDGSTTTDMDMNIWYVEKTAEGWSDPVPLDKSINGSVKESDEWPMNYEAGPSTDAEGNLYYWTKSSKTKGTNIYMASKNTDGSYSQPVELIEPSDHNTYDTKASFSPDGNYMFFSSSNNYETYGKGDIFYSKKVNGKWTKAKNLGPEINSMYYEGTPVFSPDGKYFYFGSSRSGELDANGNRSWNIYYMETAYLNVD